MFRNNEFCVVENYDEVAYVDQGSGWNCGCPVLSGAVHSGSVCFRGVQFVPDSSRGRNIYLPESGTDARGLDSRR